MLGHTAFVFNLQGLDMFSFAPDALSKLFHSRLLCGTISSDNIQFLDRKMAFNTNYMAEAKALQSQLAAISLFNPDSRRDMVMKCQALINLLQDPGDKATETFMSVSEDSPNKVQGR